MKPPPPRLMNMIPITLADAHGESAALVVGFCINFGYFRPGRAADVHEPVCRTTNIERPPTAPNTRFKEVIGGVFSFFGTIESLL